MAKQTFKLKTLMGFSFANYDYSTGKPVKVGVTVVTTKAQKIARLRRLFKALVRAGLSQRDAKRATIYILERIRQGQNFHAARRGNSRLFYVDCDPKDAIKMLVAYILRGKKAYLTNPNYDEKHYDRLIG